jgi:hypothetical protein
MDRETQDVLDELLALGTDDRFATFDEMDFDFGTGMLSCQFVQAVPISFSLKHQCVFAVWLCTYMFFLFARATLQIGEVEQVQHHPAPGAREGRD